MPLLTPGYTAHKDVGGRDTFANTSHSDVSPNPAPRGLVPISAGQKKALDDRPKNDSYRHAKKAKNDRMIKKEDGGQ
jgi:hypothetical protein